MALSHIFSWRRLGGRVFLMALIMVLLVLLNGLFTFYFLSLASTAKDEEIARQAEYDNLGDFIKLLSQQTESVYLAVESGSSGVTTFARKQQVNTDEKFQDLEATLASNGQFPQLRETYKQVQHDFDTVLASANSRDQAERLLNSTQSLRRQFFDQLDSLLKDRQSALNDALSRTRGQLDAIFRTTSLALLASTFLALALALIIPRLFTRPLKNFSNNLATLAAGDLTNRFQVGGAVEMSELGQTLNRALARLRLVISRIQIQAGTITATGTYLERAGTEQASSLSQQAVAVSEVSATIGELSNTSIQIAESAELVAGSANAALRSAEGGYNTLLGASKTMMQINEQVNQIADRIIALNIVSQRIREAVALISTLSDDTHLLALNAAIESAGAGEEGARFAIVAGQVRKLAQRSRQAAVEIQQLVSQIQQATTASVMATEEGLKVVKVGQQMVEKSLYANQDIISLVQQTSQLAEAISMATGQQRSASSQVAETMHELAKIIAAISANSQQFLGGANDLTEVARQLNMVVSIFKIHESGLAMPAADGSGPLAEIKNGANGAIAPAPTKKAAS